MKAKKHCFYVDSLTVQTDYSVPMTVTTPSIPANCHKISFRFCTQCVFVLTVRDDHNRRKRSKSHADGSITVNLLTLLYFL